MQGALESMFDMSEVFDASSLFWEFLESVINNTYDSLICTDTFYNFTQGIHSKESLGLTLETLFFSDNDLRVLNVALDQNPYYDDATRYFVFRHISQLLREVESMYSDIISIHCVSQEQFDCVQKYQPRYELVKKCIRKIYSDMFVKESEHMFDNLTI